MAIISQSGRMFFLASRCLDPDTRMRRQKLHLILASPRDSTMGAATIPSNGSTVS
jgi:hypothetical protein